MQITITIKLLCGGTTHRFGFHKMLLQNIIFVYILTLFLIYRQPPSGVRKGQIGVHREVRDFC